MSLGNKFRPAQRRVQCPRLCKAIQAFTLFTLMQQLPLLPRPVPHAVRQTRHLGLHTNFLHKNRKNCTCLEMTGNQFFTVEMFEHKNPRSVSISLQFCVFFFQILCSGWKISLRKVHLKVENVLWCPHEFVFVCVSVFMCTYSWLSAVLPAYPLNSPSVCRVDLLLASSAVSLSVYVTVCIILYSVL